MSTINPHRRRNVERLIQCLAWRGSEMRLAELYRRAELRADQVDVAVDHAHVLGLVTIRTLGADIGVTLVDDDIEGAIASRRRQDSPRRNSENGWRR
jgi:hypothetical protein